jgi:hypothetical protein
MGQASPDQSVLTVIAASVAPLVWNLQRNRLTTLKIAITLVVGRGAARPLFRQLETTAGLLARCPRTTGRVVGVVVTAICMHLVCRGTASGPTWEIPDT